jgi:glycosyltransferase involved in cell wall biosynthesis
MTRDFLPCEPPDNIRARDQQSDRQKIALRMLVIHQSAELYGPDRSLLELLGGIDSRDFECIICLPAEGPLAVVLRLLGLEVHVLPLLIINRETFSCAGFSRFAMQLAGAVRALDRLLAKRHVDIVYTNTLAVLDGMLWARARGCPHVWHVREIHVRPRLTSFMLRTLARRCADKLVCNSHKTLAWLSAERQDDAKYSVVWNGVQDQPWAPEDKAAACLKLGLRPDLPIVLMVARINDWKGHDLLLDAIAILEARGCHDFQLIMLGSPAPGQERLLPRLRLLVAASPAAARIHLRDFAVDTSIYYQAADCLVVPSREPEPFGRVAIEAMAYGVPVIAANHGGLSEIVLDQFTGMLFPPNAAEALSYALEQMLAADDVRALWGRNAYLRQQSLFSLTGYRGEMMAIFHSVLV